MALIKHANLHELARDALVLDLGDIHRQGETMLAQARDRAARVIASAQAERARLISDAAALGRAEGQAKGVEEGRAVGQEQGRAAAMVEHKVLLAELAQAWTDALGAFLDQRQRLLADARRDVVRLAAVIAEKVVKRRIELDPSLVQDQLESVLALVLKPSRLTVSINPADRAVLQTALPAIAGRFESVAHAELVDDPSLPRGSCVAKVSDLSESGSTPSGRLDASLRTQLDRIVEALLPGDGPLRELAPAVGEPTLPTPPQPQPAPPESLSAQPAPPPPPPAASPSDGQSDRASGGDGAGA